MCSCHPLIRKFIVFTAALAVIAVLPPVATESSEISLKVEIVSPREGETVHGAIRIEARVNHPEQADFVDFYIQEPGAADRYSWKEYSPPYVWGGKGYVFDTTLFADGKASIVAFVYSGGSRKPVAEKRVHFVIDNGKPDVRIVAFPQTPVLGPLHIQIEAHDAKGIRNRPGVAVVHVHVNGSEAMRLIRPPFHADIDTCLLVPGAHSIRVVAEDTDGMTASDSAMFAVLPEKGAGPGGR